LLLPLLLLLLFLLLLLSLSLLLLPPPPLLLFLVVSLMRSELLTLHIRPSFLVSLADLRGERRSTRQDEGGPAGRIRQHGRRQRGPEGRRRQPRPGLSGAAPPRR